jgi:hypothetical protein
VFKKRHTTKSLSKINESDEEELSQISKYPKDKINSVKELLVIKLTRV